MSVTAPDAAPPAPAPVLPAASGLVRTGGVALLLLLLVLAGFGASPSALANLQETLGLAVFAVSTNLLIGYGGLVSFGQAAFYGIGAYGVAALWLHWQLPFWAGILVGTAVAALAAVVMGVISLRSRRLYFALLTLAFTQLFYVIAEDQRSFTQGASGIFNLSMIPTWLSYPRNGYFFTLAVATVVLAGLWQVVSSPFGATLRAIRDNRERAEALGVNVYLHQVLAFVLSAVGCSIAGALYAVYSQSASPDLLNWTTSGQPIFMALFGGIYSFFGPVVGAFGYHYAERFVTERIADWQLVLGLLLLLVVVFRADGIAGALGDLWRWTRQHLSAPSRFHLPTARPRHR